MQRAQLATQLHRLQLSAPFPPSLLRAPVDFTVRLITAECFFPVHIFEAFTGRWNSP
jgi:hypothetical protein